MLFIIIDYISIHTRCHDTDIAAFRWPRVSATAASRYDCQPAAADCRQAISPPPPRCQMPNADAASFDVTPADCRGRHTHYGQPAVILLAFAAATIAYAPAIISIFAFRAADAAAATTAPPLTPPPRRRAAYWRRRCRCRRHRYAATPRAASRDECRRRVSPAFIAASQPADNARRITRRMTPHYCR